MAAFTNFIDTIAYQPNPNLNLDGSFPATLALPDYSQPGDPAAGEVSFHNTPYNPGSTATCTSCHPADPGIGTDGVIDASNTMSTSQPMKHPQLRNQYQKTNVDFTPKGVSVNGFGFRNDGTIMLFDFLTGFPLFKDNDPLKANVEAFLLCFDTGTAPAVGYSRTLTAATVNTAPAQSDWSTLQSQASPPTSAIDLIANGTIQGQIQGLLYLPATAVYETGTAGLGPFTQAQLTAFIQGGDTLTIMGVPPGSGPRLGLGSNRSAVLKRNAQTNQAAMKAVR